jgi:multidrug efflux pump subunit AcrA (membrane-fusion protein)
MSPPKRKGIVVALIAGALVVVAAVALSMNRKQQGPLSEGAPAQAAFSVVLGEAREMVFEDVLSVAGGGQSKNRALVSARVAGTLDAIYVDEGDAVQAGQTKLFQTDSLKLAKGVEIARQELAVAECALREREAYLEQVQAGSHQDEVDLKRLQRLYDKGVATEHEFEEADSKFKESFAAVKHARATVDLAEAQVGQARSSLSMAEKDLADSRVTAPIDGRVVRRLCEPGEMANTDTVVLEIEDLSVLEISAYLPEEYYARVHPGETHARVHVAGVDLGEQQVSYRSPTVDPRLRTFEVRCIVRNPSSDVVPGALAKVDVILQRREGVGVPTEALQQRKASQVVFVVSGEEARQVPVQTGLETGGFTEITGGGIAAGASVVVMGQYYLDDGAPIAVVKE